MKNLFILLAFFIGLPALTHAQKVIRLDSRDTTVFNIETIHGQSTYNLRKDTTLASGHYEVYETFFRAKNPVITFQIGQNGNFCGTYIQKTRNGKEIKFKRDYDPCNDPNKPAPGR